MSNLKDLLALHRLRFPVPINTLGQALWGACFAVASPRGLLRPPVLITLLANALLIVGPLALNSAVDVNTDRQDSAKAYLASAAGRLGRGALLWPSAEMAGAFLLAIPVSGWTGRWLVAGFAVLIIVAQLLYNIEPVRLKRHGLAGTIVFGLAATTLPCLLSYQAVRSVVDAWLWPVFLGLGIMAIGRNALWSVPDREADRATGMGTSAVRYGVAGTLAWTGVVMLAGNLLLGWGLWWRYGFLWSLLGSAAYLAFLGAVMVPRQRRTTHLIRGALPLVALGDMLVAAVPLLA